jgi:hypothetical protein
MAANPKRDDGHGGRPGKPTKEITTVQSSAPVTQQTALKLTIGYWRNFGTAKILAHTGDGFFDHVQYGVKHTRVKKRQDGEGPDQQAILCCPNSGVIASDTDDDARFMKSRTAKFIDRSLASTIRNDDHYHVLIDCRHLPRETWPKQASLDGWDIKSAGFVPMPGSMHYTGQEYRAAHPDGKVHLVTGTPELLAAMCADRAEHNKKDSAKASSNGSGHVGGLFPAVGEKGLNSDYASLKGRMVSGDHFTEEETHQLIRLIDRGLPEPMGETRLEASVLKNKGWQKKSEEIRADLDGIGDGLTVQPDQKAFDKDVRAERRRQHVVRTARHLDAAEAWETPEDAGSLAEQAAAGISDPSWLVESLIPSKGFAQIVAQWKAGKTTLASVNLAVDLAAGFPFLGAYDTDLQAGRNVGIWNLEVGAATLQRWMMKRGADDAALKRIFPLHLRGRSVELMAPVAAAWTAEWLERNAIAVWIIDPLSRLYHGKENDPTEFTAWWGALEKIARLGGVDVVILVHHAGHAPPGESDSKPRARGASSMMGNPDVLISYRHAGGIGEAPSGPARYLSAFGRDVDFEEITLRFDSATQELRTDSGSKGRKHDALRSLAKRAADVIEDSGPMNATELKAAMGRAKDEDKVAAIRIAVSGFELIETKKGQAKVYSRGTGKVVQRGGDEQ